MRGKVLLGAIVVLALLHLVGTGDSQHRNWEFLPEMVEAVPYESQAQNPVFPDGKTLQTPPEGTTARGLLPLHVGDTLLRLDGNWKDLKREEQDAWDLFTPGFEIDKRGLARGGEIFATVCSTCHGAAGHGDGKVTKRGVPPPPSLLAANAKQMSDGRMYRMITRGDGNMPGHAVQVLRKDRWSVIRFIRTIQ